MIRTSDGVTGVDCGSGHVAFVAPGMVDLGMHIERMDAHEIDLTILATPLPGVDGLPAPEAVAIARECNDELVAVCAGAPGRLAALALLPAQAPERAAEELERARSMGMVGGQIFGNVNGTEVYEDHVRPLFDAAAELDMPLRVHPTVREYGGVASGGPIRTTLGHVFDSSTAALGLILSGLFDRHPCFKLVVPHVGGVLPYLAGRADYEAGRFRGRLGAPAAIGAPSEYLACLYLDTACASPMSLRLAVEFSGAQRVMFGTDYPLCEERTALDVLAAADLGTETTRCVLGDSAVDLFNLKPVLEGSNLPGATEYGK